MKRNLVIATGGTIASVKDVDGYRPGLSGRELVDAVPEIKEVCDLDVIQLMNIDSTNMRPSHWLDICDCIMEHYESYDGFVVLHGTDTMSYTAAALSYLIQGSSKPIVLTGSQRPLQNPFTDVKLNLYQSLVYASDDDSSDVVIVFASSVIAGTRSRKQRTMSHNAFTSINFPQLATIRDDHVLRPSFAKRSVQNELVSYKKLNEKVCVVKLTPGLQPSLFLNLAQSFDGIIIETFGMGGIPEYSNDGMSFKDVIYEIADAGKTIVLTTQVPEEGVDMGVYEVGRAYTNHPGILLGDDMTSESLLAKTMWALGNAQSHDEIKTLFYKTINYDRIGV